MSYPIDEKLVVSIASSALFDLSESDKVFRDKGEEEYKKYQIEKIDEILKPGTAFSFIKRLLNLNKLDSEPVEVILLSRNSPETGLRVMRSIKHYGLNITRAGFLNGNSPYKYIPAFNSALFLSENEDDVLNAVEKGYPAGKVIKSLANENENDHELRIAFDFDGVIADDESEQVYKQGDLNTFQNYESEKSKVPHNPGPLQGLFTKLAKIQQQENQKEEADPDYKKIIKISIITARNAPTHERMITTLKKWGVETDELFLMGGIKKAKILEVLKPHIFFDDQMSHIDPSKLQIPSVHIPFGIRNTKD